MNRKYVTSGNDIKSIPSEDRHSIEDRGEYDNDPFSCWDDGDQEGTDAAHKHREGCWERWIVCSWWEQWAIIEGLYENQSGLTPDFFKFQFMKPQCRLLNGGFNTSLSPEEW